MSRCKVVLVTYTIKKVTFLVDILHPQVHGNSDLACDELRKILYLATVIDVGVL